MHTLRKTATALLTRPDHRDATTGFSAAPAVAAALLILVATGLGSGLLGLL